MVHTTDLSFKKLSLLFISVDVKLPYPSVHPIYDYITQILYFVILSCNI